MLLYSFNTTSATRFVPHEDRICYLYAKMGAVMAALYNAQSRSTESSFFEFDALQDGGPDDYIALTYLRRKPDGNKLQLVTPSYQDPADFVEADAQFRISRSAQGCEVTALIIATDDSGCVTDEIDSHVSLTQSFTACGPYLEECREALFEWALEATKNSLEDQNAVRTFIEGIKSVRAQVYPIRAGLPDCKIEHS